MKNRPATRNVKPGAFRNTRVVSGSAIAINAPLSSTTKIGTRIIRIPRTHRPPYICPSPGRSPERIAANPGEAFVRSAANVRGRDSCARVLGIRFDMGPLGYETRRARDGPPGVAFG